MTAKSHMTVIRSRFGEGETIVRRDVFLERVWTASPLPTLPPDLPGE
ncbi:hypothetical protein [Microtetraspora fusca]|uniref:Uncharacterized protein n=1 Tax=Microtetraspora fusca TaxID=1997 RepID=A0ABW6VF26_MICFU|nr:hypothetical protein [Microtetraspora fusca]